MNENKELTTRVETNAIVDLKAQVGMIQELQREILKADIHFGKIPGTDKPTLLKPGAEKIVTIFRLSPHFETQTIDMGNGHREYMVKCTLVHIPTDNVWGQASGSCSTKESKFRYRWSKYKCPLCQQETIFKNKQGTGYYCYAKIGGCGANFEEDEARIINQKIGKIENPDIADTYNTVLKMAEKRALVAAVLITTGASDIYTQDLEDFTNSYQQKNSTPIVQKGREIEIKKIIKEKLTDKIGWNHVSKEMAKSIWEKLQPIPADFSPDMIDVLINEQNKEER